MRNIALILMYNGTAYHGWQVQKTEKTVAETLEQALPILGQKLAGYDQPDAVLTAVESRSSSPVRIPRDETYQSSLPGLYPCGEGAGYAGGILSAAADGMRCAEQIYRSISQEV